MREEGPAALYKGFIPKVLRLAPGGGVLLLVVEFTLEVFRKGSISLLSPVMIHLTFSLYRQLSDLPTLKWLKLNEIQGTGGRYTNHTSMVDERFLGCV